MNEEKIAFLVDSCADLLPEHRVGVPVYVVPLRIAFPDGEFNDGETIYAEDVYRRLDAGQTAKTSLPDLLRVAETLDQIHRDGYERVITLPLSAGLSGTYNLFRLHCTSRDDLDARVFETCSGSLGIGMIVLQLWEDIKAGMSWEQLVNERVPALIANTHPYFSVDTLEYLQKGGRIGKITAFAGTLLNIKPVLGFAETGELTNVAKARGREQLKNTFVELLRKDLGDHKEFNLAVANGGAPEEMEDLKQRVLAAFPGCQHIWDSRLDATLSTYIGKGVLGAAVQLL